MDSPSPQRLHSLDAVRGGALLLGIFFHAAFSFLPGDQIWIVADTQRSDAISGTAFVLHIFRMSLFFILAGYFARMQANRLGTGGFVKDRLKRIGVPLVVFWPIMIACFTGIAIWSFTLLTAAGAPESAMPPPPPMTAETFPLTHLWFLYMLLVLYAGTLLARALLKVTDLADRLGRLADKALSWRGIGIALPIVLAIPVAWAFMNQPEWHAFFGIPAPEYGFVPNRIAVVAYGIAFLLGWVLQRSLDHLSQVTKLWPAYLVIAALLSVYCLTQIGTTFTYVQPLPEAAEIVYPVAYAIAVWTWCLGLIGLAMKIWSKESGVRRYIADSSYWLYLIHLPVVMALQVWVSQWALAAEIKYLIVLGLSVPLMLLSYELLVRYTFVGWILNGKKRKRANTAMQEAPA